MSSAAQMPAVKKQKRLFNEKIMIKRKINAKHTPAGSENLYMILRKKLWQLYTSKESPGTSKEIPPFVKLKDLIDAFFPDVQPSAEIPDIAFTAHAVYKVYRDQNRRDQEQKIPFLYPGQPGSDIIHDASGKDQQ